MIEEIRYLFAHTQVFMSLFLFWFSQNVGDLYFLIVFTMAKCPGGVMFVTNNLVYLSIEPPWTLTRAEESELSLSMESEPCYQV